MNFKRSEPVPVSFVAKFKINLVFFPHKDHAALRNYLSNLFPSFSLKLLFMEIFKKMIYIPTLKKDERKL